MNADVLFRPYQDADAAPLTELIHAAYAELGAMGLNYTAVDQSVEVTRQRAQDGQCWVAVRDGELIGTATMTFPLSDGLKERTTVAHHPRRAWLNQLAVAPEARGTGLAADLWRLAQEWARESGITSVGLDTAEPATHLVRLYEKWGFARVDTIHWPGKAYDSVVMTLSLI